MVGDMVFMVTIMLWIATKIAEGKAWAPAAVSGALMATAIPVLVVGPFAGVWVDRWDRRRTMLVADAARFLLIASLLVIPMLKAHHLGRCSTRHPVCRTRGGKFVRRVLQPVSTGHRRSHRAAGRPDQCQRSTPGNGGTRPGLRAAARGTALDYFGVQWALIANALSFGISFLYVRAIHLPAIEKPVSTQRSSFGAEFRVGLRFFAHSKVLVGLTLGSVIVMVGIGAVNAIAVFFIATTCTHPLGWVGIVSAAVGAGAVLGAIAPAR